MDHEIILLAQHYIDKLDMMLSEDPNEGQGWDAHLFSISETAQRIVDLANRK